MHWSYWNPLPLQWKMNNWSVEDILRSIEFKMYCIFQYIIQILIIVAFACAECLFYRHQRVNRSHTTLKVCGLKLLFSQLRYWNRVHLVQFAIACGHTLHHIMHVKVICTQMWAQGECEQQPLIFWANKTSLFWGGTAKCRTLSSYWLLVAVNMYLWNN